MLVVKIELHSAVTGKVTLLGKMLISNVSETGLKSDTRADYYVELGRKGRLLQHEIEAMPAKTTMLKNWPRLSKTVWQMVQRALNQLYPKDVQSIAKSLTNEISAS